MLKNDTIGESVYLIDDLLKYAEDESIDGILFPADIEKAFDSVDHNFMFAALKRFGFGNDCFQWIKTIFKCSQSSVMNNGTSTAYFNLGRGARQGDHNCLSWLLSPFHGLWQSFVTIGSCNHLMRIISTYVGNTKKNEISGRWQLFKLYNQIWVVKNLLYFLLNLLQIINPFIRPPQGFVISIR